MNLDQLQPDSAGMRPAPEPLQSAPPSRDTSYVSAAERRIATKTVKRSTTPEHSLSGLWPFLRPYRVRAMLALLFLFLGTAATMALPFAIRHVIDAVLGRHGIAPRTAQELRSYFLILIGVVVALGVATAGRVYFIAWLGEKVAMDLRDAIYRHVLKQGPEFFETTQTGDILSCLGADITLVQLVVGGSLAAGLRNGLMAAAALVLLIWINPGTMLQVVAILAVVLLPTLHFGQHVRQLSRDRQDRISETNVLAAEVLGSTNTVQSHTAEEYERYRFSAANKLIFGTGQHRARLRSSMMALNMIGASGALLWGLYQGTQAMETGGMTPGQLAQTVFYVSILINALPMLSNVYNDLLRAEGAAGRLLDLLARESIPFSAPESPQPLPVSDGLAIDLSSVRFSYPTRAAQPALDDFSLSIGAGETVALVGPSGAGKSTVFQLLQGFYRAQAGHVCVDGVRLQDLDLTDLRRRIALVPQDPVIYSSNAMENIRYGRLDATDEEVIRAAKLAFAHDFVLALPQGYQTPLGERGVRLSGGQRQRLAIARAILRDAPLLLLDEATSALDSESERMVQKAWDSVTQASQGKRTTVIIAHRLATVKKADRIVVIDQGRIVEEGTHDELVRNDGLYANLVSLQLE